MKGPTSVDLYPFDPGFGEALLLRFQYPDQPRWVLVDCGSSEQSARSKKSMLDIAKDIRRLVAGDGEAKDPFFGIVATHRHADHISGFQGKSWEVLHQLSPKFVVLPWTEDPNAAPDATHPTTRIRAAVREEVLKKGAPQASRQEPGSRRPGRSTGIPGLPAAGEDLVSPQGGFTRAATDVLMATGDEDLANEQAVMNLRSIRPLILVSYGRGAKEIEAQLPGVKVHVLGPPTLDDTKDILKRSPDDPGEYLQLTASALELGTRAGRGERLFPGVPLTPLERTPIEVRWFLRQLDALRGDQLVELVRVLDRSMNNTSVILLFEVCGKKLLFGGDAELHEWSYALDEKVHKQVEPLLAGMDVYKVSHHGSRNATPKKLWEYMLKPDPKRKGPHPLLTVMSTKPGRFPRPRKDKQGHTIERPAETGTEVPNQGLVRVMEEKSNLYRTDTGCEHGKPRELPLHLAP